MTEHMDEAYYSMIQITQQMKENGFIGALLLDYMSQKNAYYIYKTKRKLSDELINVSFPNSSVNFASYYDSLTHKCLFDENLMVPGYDLLDAPELVTAAGNSLRGLSATKTKKSNGLVISMLGQDSYQDKQLYTYVEMNVKLDEYLEQNSKLADNNIIPIDLLQLDTMQTIKYSSNGSFKTGESFDLDDFDAEKMYTGMKNGYFIVAKRSEIGYTNVFAVQEKFYRKEIYQWRNRIFLILFLSIIMLYLSVLTIYRLICRPLQLFGQEIEQAGQGNLEEAEYELGIAEFDQLLKQFGNMKGQIRKLLEEVETEEKKRSKMEVEKLMYKINPHFLLNTLNSVHWMAQINKQKDIGDFLSSLIFLLSYNLGKQNGIATFRSELEFLKKYVKLQKMRYDFEVDIQVEEGDYLDQPTIRLLLQPLVENALRHGLGETGKLFIYLFQDEKKGYAVITIKDNGKGLNLEQLDKLNRPFQYKSDGSVENDGVGLRYVRSMLESFYGGRAFLTINSELGKGTKVTLLLPLEGNYD
jgi:sensor histidine kinase YesM